MSGYHIARTCLLTDGPSTEHRETALHEEDHSPGKKQVEDIESRRHLAHGRVGVIERGADRGGRVVGRCLAVGNPVEFAHGDVSSAQEKNNELDVQ